MRAAGVPSNPGRALPATRYFHVAAALVMLAVMLAGFHPFYLRGGGMARRQIAPDLLPLVVVHGAAMTAWVAVFLVQALLIPARMLRLHMKLAVGRGRGRGSGGRRHGADAGPLSALRRRGVGGHLRAHPRPLACLLVLKSSRQTSGT